MHKNLFKRYPFTTFYVLALLIVIGIMGVFFMLLSIDPKIATLQQNLVKYIYENGYYSNTIQIGKYALEHHRGAWLILLFAGAPAIAAIMVTFLGNGTTGLRRLFSCFKPVGNGVTWKKGMSIYATFAIIYFGVAAFYLLLANKCYGKDPMEAFYVSQAIFKGAPLAVFFTLLLGAFIDEGGALEELGWRGFGLPVLMNRMKSPLGATMVLGVLWMLWHLPREIPTLLSGTPLNQWLHGQSVFLLLCLALSIIITYMFNLTGGSVWAGILVHGGTNVWAKALGAPVDQILGIELRTYIVIFTALIILVAAGPKLGQNYLSRKI